MTSMVLSIDLGTTNCKILTIDASGKVAGKAVTEYPISIPRTGWAEQSPEVWWEAVKDSIRRVLADADSPAIKAIGLSGQMHGLVIIDKYRTVIRPAILWNDQRSSPQCEEIYETVGGVEGLLRCTNNAMLPGYTGGKILWVREHEKSLYKRIGKVLLPKDYIRFRLTGELGTDVSDASGTGLFDVRKRCWSRELLELLRIPHEWLPEVSESHAATSQVAKTAADELGLSSGIPVIAGGGDAVMQTVGSSSIDERSVLIVIGTGGNVTVSVPEIRDNPGGKLQIFCHVLPRRYAELGATLNAGSALRWFRDTFADAESAVSRESGTDVYDILNREAERSAPGAGGLVFLPYLLGERCPHPDPKLRGVIFGLGPNTRKPDIVRSIMEGVTYSLKDVLDTITETGIDPRCVIASGGGAKSRVWLQILADVFEREVRTHKHGEDASAVGAAIVAGFACGFWRSIEDAAKRIPVETTTLPRTDNTGIYRDLFGIYRSLHRSLKPDFDRLGSVLARD